MLEPGDPIYRMSSYMSNYMYTDLVECWSVFTLLESMPTSVQDSPTLGLASLSLFPTK